MVLMQHAETEELSVVHRESEGGPAFTERSFAPLTLICGYFAVNFAVVVLLSVPEVPAKVIV